MGSDTEGEMLDEEADEAEEMTTNFALRAGLKGRLNAVNKALEKIEKGEYGKCEKCGGEISGEVLEVDPESELCKTCKAKS